MQSGDARDAGSDDTLRSERELLEAAEDVWRLNELLLNDIVKLTNNAAQEGDLKDISTPLQIEHALERCRSDLRRLMSGGVPGLLELTLNDEQPSPARTAVNQQGAVDADGWPIDRRQTLMRSDSASDYLNSGATRRSEVGDYGLPGAPGTSRPALTRGDSVGDYIASGKYDPNAQPARRTMKAERHLLFLVHGIGQHNDFGRDEEGSQANPNEPTYGQDFKRQIEAMREARLGESPLELTVRTIEWHSVMHRSGQDELLDACSPDGIPEIRTVTKSNVMDFVGYTTPAYGQLIIDTVAQGLETKYAEFVNERPGWDGKVSLLGHSLGSVIILDLLTNGGRSFQGISYPQLSFNVTNFFALGSPAAPFLISRRQVCPSHPPHRYICYIRYTAAPFLISRRQVSVLPDEVTSPSPRDEQLPPPLQLNCDHIFNVVTPIDPVSHFLSPLVKATPQGPHLRSVVDAAAVLNPMVQPPGEA